MCATGMKATGELQGISFPAPDMQSFGYSIIIQFLIVLLTTLSATHTEGA